jgi:hypothetical protein
MAGKRAVAVGLLAAAICCGSAAGATIPVLWMDVHARLAPATGTTPIGRFTGTLLIAPAGTDSAEPSDDLPPATGLSMLTWKLRLPALHGPRSALLVIRTTTGAAATTRTLCASCSTAASGKLNLTVAQGLRIVKPGAVVVVRAASATLRGRVAVYSQIVTP